MSVDEQQKTLLSAKNRTLSLQWVQTHPNLSVEDWENISSSKESISFFDRQMKGSEFPVDSVN